MSIGILRLSCPDRIGLLARIAGFVADHGGNLVEVHQFTDLEAGWFFTRMEIDTQAMSMSLNAFSAAFEPLGEEMKADWAIRAASNRMKVVIMVSKLGHCLADLLWRWRSGELDCEITCVISNHDDLRQMVEREGLEFCHIPMSPETRSAAFEKVGEKVRALQPGLIVLARYMQIIPGDLCAEFSGRIINIHHSFLPSFVGANPYQRAHERGVKLIGATCHYASAELDAGPIIDQEVIRVEHFHTTAGLVRLGRECERLALARSVRWLLADRVLLHGNRTIVFGD